MRLHTPANRYPATSPTLRRRDCCSRSGWSLLRSCGLQFALRVGLLSALLVSLAAGLGMAQGPPKAPPSGLLLDGSPYDYLQLPDKDGVPFEVHIEALDKPPAVGAQTLVYVLFPEVDTPRRMLKWEKRDDYIYRNWPTLLMEEAKDLIRQNETTKAYSNLLYLKTNFPETPGLDEAFKEFLYLDIIQMAKEKRYAESLSSLEQLFRRDPEYRSASGPAQSAMLAALISRMTDNLYEEKRYPAMRVFLYRIQNEYVGNRSAAAKLPDVAAAVTRQLDILLEDAKKGVEQARTLLAGKQFQAARLEARKAQGIWPEVPGVGELLQEIADTERVIHVGVSQPVRQLDPVSINDWGARRVGRLTLRTLLRFVGQGADGGEYMSPLGAVEWDEDARLLSFLLRRNDSPLEGRASTPLEISQRLLDLANPAASAYYPQWARLLQSVSIENADKLVAQIRFQHVHPRALLKRLVTPRAESLSESEALDGLYVIEKDSGDELLLQANPDYAGAGERLRILETVYPTASDAYVALKRGEIDLCDRLFPADAARLHQEPSSASQVMLGRYDLPTLHMLVPNDRSPHMQRKTFRRAIEYGLNRQVVLEQNLLGGRELPGCRVLSGPFPIEVPNNVGLGYAYDDRIMPREWEPKLAIMLAQLAERELAQLAKARNETVPERTTLVLAHPATEVARIASGAFAEQLSAIGIKVVTKELPPGVYNDPERDYDLLYAEISMSEPLVDARAVFGENGVAPFSGPYIDLALRRLDEAPNWDHARRRLNDLHRIVASDIAVIPLYQVMEHFAYHRSLQGITQRRLNLYDEVDNWRLRPLEVATVSSP
ncbi:ABC transporter substrate-binding protein [Lignipirellula cremea]|uniref:Bacterial extracellular solute-binding protein, family 5 Middle n=1 Tax=Lignipirellula cremea TaxID=2528010 RepID=A0A518DSG5_9BACT|nr:ABC transporter substrate-binding protein [Lignipirellula cremea]QDU94728.1 Bacterial extracellular solute-binding protein, family 5 Middle [Lignipirellula cremea]